MLQGTESAYRTHDEIAALAYRKYVERGGYDGHDPDDWLEAERELRRGETALVGAAPGRSYRVRGQGVVLRIQRSQNGEVVTLRVSGDLADEYLAELERVVDAEGVHRRLVLDLEEVRHVTRDGLRLLARLEASGTRILICPQYLRGWISRERD